MDEMFDVQKDYMTLITHALRLLKKEGVIFFSTNSRRFAFQEESFPRCKIEEISAKTIPEDFNKKNIHRCWKIRHSHDGTL